MEKEDNWGNNYILSIDKALKAGVPKLKCFVYQISVGGKEYIGFTSQNPKKRMEQHLESAQNDSTQKLHQELRRFGYLHEFKVISEHDNEVLGLVAEISNIQKFKPELNVSIGGEGNNYEVIEDKNHLGEKIFYVKNKALAENSSDFKTINEIKVIHYIKLIDYFYARYEQNEIKYLKNKLNLNCNIKEVVNYFFSEIKSEFECYVSTGFVGGWPNSNEITYDNDIKCKEIYINHIHDFFYNYEKNVEIKFNEDEVRKYVLERLKTRYNQHKKFLEWININRPLFEFCEKHSVKILTKYYKWNWDSFIDENKIDFLETIDVNRLLCFKSEIGQTFNNKSQVKGYIKNQSWFKKGVNDNIFKHGDAFFPIVIKGFLSSKKVLISFSEM